MKKIELNQEEQLKLSQFLEIAMLKVLCEEEYPIKYREVVFDNLEPYFVAKFWQEIIELENKGFEGILGIHFFLRETAERYLNN